MMDKLQAISNRLEAVVTQMEDPATYADPDLRIISIFRIKR